MTDSRRNELHTQLCKLLGSKQVYYQPPSTVKMKYPAIVYNLEAGRIRYADNNTYLFRRRYSVTVIDKDPDACWDIKTQDAFEYCEFQRWYAADNLNHWQFSLYW